MTGGPAAGVRDEVAVIVRVRKGKITHRPAGKVYAEAPVPTAAMSAAMCKAAFRRFFPDAALAAAGLLVSPAAAYAGSDGVLDPQGPIASAERLLMINATEIMLVVVVPVIIATLAFAWWYRSSNARAQRTLGWSYQGSIEFVVWSIPALVVILLSGVCWIGAHQLDPRAPIEANAKPLQIDVVSLDWKWLFLYQDQDVATLNQLVIPIGTPVKFRLTSATVMNSFLVPQLAGQIYTMPGMTTYLNLLADKAGDYPGISANFSGDGFADMRFTLKAVPPDAFERWVAEAHGAAAALDDAAYAQLAKPSSAVPPATYRSVAPNLFQRIIDQTTSSARNANGGG
jgi:cytochrome o ubiquinol oxidase subunit 2